ncbi:MAG: aminomethyl-transferring glycine dehydrogenase subunit GcvPA [Candidatus Omnitrophota bacterium]|nr:aminomethyl-transferring glycine dehydrogenase subunit GcvPA [Candidatus Omnitrophota bacterium]
MNYSPHTQKDKKQMLDAIGVASVEDLLKAIPQQFRLQKLDLPEGISELELKALLSEKAARNRSTHELTSFLGAGAYEHYIPQVVEAVISRGEFLTAYTPYQAEASQGTLQAIYEYQSLICELTGMDVANASMYDGASALAEAVLLSVRETGRKRLIFSSSLHPEYKQVIKTYLEGYKVESVEIPHREGLFDEDELRRQVNEDTACVIVQNPNFFGFIENAEKIESVCHSRGALLIACVNPISLGILRSPGEYNADIAVGEGQPLGIPLNYGGPYLGFFAVKEKHMRKMPGRIVGMTKDIEGKRGYVLTMQAREQHIRREKATSNICTNEGLMALAACVYLSLLGKEGIKEVARQNIFKSHYLKDGILKLSGYELMYHRPFFNEFIVRCGKDPDKIISELLKHGIIGGLPLGRFYPDMKNCMLICATETKTKEDMDKFVELLGKH